MNERHEKLTKENEIVWDQIQNQFFITSDLEIACTSMFLQNFLWKVPPW